MSGNDLEIILTGDFFPGGCVEELCLDEDFDGIYNDLLPLLREKDLSITNLECPLTARRNPIVKSGSNLAVDPVCIGGISHGGFDVVALANNHVLDQGESGLRDTLEVCEKAGVEIVGAGGSLEEASRPLFLPLRGNTVAVINVAEHEFSIAGHKRAGANPLDLAANYRQIRESREKADIVMVVVHGGNEHYHLPSPRMAETCRLFADLGASAVVVHHSHIGSGYEMYNGVPIFYGLGNFLFDTDRRMYDAWYEGYIVKLKFSPVGASATADCAVTITPYTQCGNHQGLQLMGGEERERFLSRIDEYSRIILNPEMLHGEWIRFCRSWRTSYISNLFSLNRVQRKLMKAGLYRPLFFRKKRFLRLLNLFTCESHREAMIGALKDEIYGERGENHSC